MSGRPVNPSISNSDCDTPKSARLVITNSLASPRTKCWTVSFDITSNSGNLRA